MIYVEDIKFGYSKDMQILKGVTTSIDKGEIVNILGANGCGKSTLLKIMLGIYKTDSGKVFINNKNIDAIKRAELAKYLSYVPQFHNAVFPYLVEEVVLMGRSMGSIWKNYTKKDYEVVIDVLKALKIDYLKDRVYSKISGGERQLVLVARAMAQGSGFCFMDEPVASLDYGNQYRLLNAVKELSEKGITFIITTHHPDHARYLGGRSILMKNGVIYKDGKTTNVINEKSLYDLYRVKIDDTGRVYDVD